MNYQNSPSNYNNSPSNYSNNQSNYNATNGVFDNSGNRIGYEVTAPTGVTNIFDNNDNQIRMHLMLMMSCRQSFVPENINHALNVFD